MYNLSILYSIHRQNKNHNTKPIVHFYLILLLPSYKGVNDLNKIVNTQCIDMYDFLF